MGSVGLIAYKVIHICLIAACAYFISDCKRKAGMKAIVNARWMRALKALYLLPVLAYAAHVALIQTLRTADLLGLGCTLLSAAILAKAKTDLAGHHTWSGYCLERPSLCCRGIYAVMRHPMYVGIIVFLGGSVVTALGRPTSDLPLPTAVAATLICVHLILAASRETRALCAALGEEGERYTRQVHAFLPIRRYRPALAPTGADELDEAQVV